MHTRNASCISLVDLRQQGVTAAQALGQGWQQGAAVFEALLVDHDWAVNTVNWAYFAGVGNDPRDRVFRTVSQGMTYDPNAELIRAWIPELAALPAEQAHQPWTVGKEYVRAGDGGYLSPLLDPSTQLAVNYGKKAT